MLSLKKDSANNFYDDQHIFFFFSAYVLTKYSEPNNNHLPLFSQRSFGNQEQDKGHALLRWFAEFLYFRHFQK